MRKFLITAFSALGVASAAAQGGPGNGPGPGPTPQPWVVNGPTVTYSRGGVALPANVTGGGEGVGTINVSQGYYVAGNPLAFANIAGLGTAATKNIGTGGATVPLLSTANTWDLVNTFTSGFISGTSSNGISFTQAGIQRFPAAGSLTVAAGAGAGTELLLSAGGFIQMSAPVIEPAANNTTSLGTSALIWSNVFASIGNFAQVVVSNSVNNSAFAQISNPNAGTAANARLLLSNNVSTSSIVDYSSTFPAAGVTLPDSLKITGAGAGGLVLTTSTTAPIIFGANNAQVGAWGSGGLTSNVPVTVPSINGGAIGSLNATAGNIPVGNGTSLNSVPITGAFTLSGTGVATLTAGQAVANLGFTPVNKAGDTMLGTLTTPVIVFPATSTGGLPLTASQNLDVFGSLNFVNNTAGTTTSDAGAFPQWRYDAGSNAQVGSKMSTTATTGAAIISILQTGSLNSTADLQLTDGGVFLIQSGSGVTSGIVIQPAAGSTTVQSPLSVTGLSTLNSINMTAEPSQIYNWAGVPTLVSDLRLLPGSSNTNPEYMHVDVMQSSGGGANPLLDFKGVSGQILVVNPGGASGWVHNGVMQLLAGSGAVGGTIDEADVLNFDHDFNLVTDNPLMVGFYATGAVTSPYYSNAAFTATGASSQWDWGFQCSQFSRASTTVTISIANPGVITWAAHGLVANQPIVLKTTGALPTGLVAGRRYYVVGASITTNTFEVAATPGGAAIATTGTQSGVQTGAGPNVFQFSCLDDASNSPTSYLITGSHVNGIDMSGATFSNAAMFGTNWLIDPVGNFHVTTLGTSGAINIGTFLQFNPVLFAALPIPCVPATEGVFQAVHDANTGTPGAVITAGGGAFKVIGYCNGTNYIVL